jgi:hypothetical protein
LLHPIWGKDFTAKQFMDRLDEWESDVDQYERQTQELISDAVKVAVVLKISPRGAGSIAVADAYDSRRLRKD